MKSVWKFPVLSTGPCEIDMPLGSRIVHVDRDPQTGLIAFWAEVEDGEAKETRRFQVVATGQPVPDRGAHVGTVIMRELVWHLCEIDTRRWN